MSNQMTQPIILLREGTESKPSGTALVLSNISTIAELAKMVASTLGPRGMDKMIKKTNGSVVCTNDGATILRELEINDRDSPILKMVTSVCFSQDDQVGDGTTSVVLLLSSILTSLKEFIDGGQNLQDLRKILGIADDVCRKSLIDSAAECLDMRGGGSLNVFECAATCLNSKILASHSKLFAQIAVEAAKADVGGKHSTSLLRIQRVPGGSVDKTILWKGAAFPKTFSYAGFEQQPKKIESPIVICLKVELELKSEKDNAEIRLKDPREYQEIVDAEWTIIYRKLQEICESGANVVLSSLPIGDLATQYFADREIFCAGRVDPADLDLVSRVCNVPIYSTTSKLPRSDCSNCRLFEERQIGSARFNFFSPTDDNCVARTVILRGGAEQFVAEVDRSLHDAICVVKRVIDSPQIVGGGGSIEMRMARALRNWRPNSTLTGVNAGIASKAPVILSAIADAVETIPRQLTRNAGGSVERTLKALQDAHASSNTWAGVDCMNIGEDGICLNLDTISTFVWEPLDVKKNAMSSAFETASLILTIDEIVVNPKSQVG